MCPAKDTTSPETIPSFEGCFWPQYNKQLSYLTLITIMWLKVSILKT